jgi:hypothetical protein
VSIVSKIRISLDKLKRTFDKMLPLFNSMAEAQLGKEIDQSIGKGISPVMGQGRLGEYKSSYQGNIKAGYQGAAKRIRPVNLSVSGKLRASQRAAVKGGKLTVTYTDPKAKHHNEGTPIMVRRAMLPTKPGEEFSRAITKFLVGIAKKSIDAVLK